MFGNYTNQFGYMNSMPTATQPYGYPMNPYTGYGANLSQQTPTTSVTNTNKIYVNGIEDVRNKSLPANSDYIFLDNDKALLYQKVVDSKGQFDVKAFDIVPHVEKEQPVEQSGYVSKTEFIAVQNKINALESELTKLMYDKAVKQEVVIDDTTSN